MSRRGLQRAASEYCLGCGAEPHEQTVALTYHDTDAFDPRLEFGYLCPVCKQQIEAILDDGHPDECERCEAPLPEAGRNHLMEFDQIDVLQNTVTLCNCCLRER